MVRPSGTRGTGSTLVGRPIHIMSRELALVAGRPCDLPGCAASADPKLSCCPLLPSNPRRGADDATCDWHGHSSIVCGGGVLGGWEVASGGAREHDPLGAGGFRP